MVLEGIKYVVMEVSSQALKYDRVNDIVFDYGIFTNLTQDHLDFYKNMEKSTWSNLHKKLVKPIFILV